MYCLRLHANWNTFGNKMSEIIEIHPSNPQTRLLQRVVEVLQNDGVIVYPTDSAYALGCKIGSKEGVSRIRHIRNLDKHHNFTLICRDLSDIASYALVDNATFRLLKAHTPGPYTFILQASREVPKMLQHPKRKTIGLRVPDNRIVQSLLLELAEPLLSVTLLLPDDGEVPVCDLTEIDEKIGGLVDIIIDGGSCSILPTTVVDLTSGVPQIVREGKGVFVE
jgi:tRNA threonylcarbamoyl adenosine modification protein (Sua5/YciO/YrdC/YwlC family)